MSKEELAQIFAELERDVDKDFDLDSYKVGLWNGIQLCKGAILGKMREEND